MGATKLTSERKRCQAAERISPDIFSGSSGTIFKKIIKLSIISSLYQVCYYLMVGQVKSVKTVLKQLQQSIQTVTSPGWPSDEEMVPTNLADNFQWLTRDHLCILVYLVTVMHSMQVNLANNSAKDGINKLAVF